ncbi:MAG: ATP-binding cassette domain-containing protein [Lachnospiraceae bacterium]|nr:ATP-binding cassette domain-containing protein [Lachnospiraceae bacterium]
MKLEVDIKKSFDDFILEANFVVEDDVFAILGASGSGKTMTLKCIAGVEKPDEGRIVLGDRVLFDSKKKIDVPARKRNIGFLFQDYALFPNMTVRENITCTAKEPSMTDEIIERFDLGSVKDLYPAQLSGGQSQRTAMARMLMTKPELIMFDEPFSALDNYLKFRIEREIYSVIDEFSGPVIMVSHDRNEVYKMADNIGVMDNGSLTDIQKKEEFFDHPKSVVATRLTGCKNVSRIENVSDDIYNATDWGIKIRIPDSLIEGVNITNVGFRAHYFKLVDGNDDVDVFKCSLERIIEDTFSVMVCFRQSGNQSDSPDSLLTWVVSKPKWDEIKDEIFSGKTNEEKSFYLKVDTGKLIVLDR